MTTRYAFELGRLLITPSALDFTDRHGIDPLALLNRHRSGDWGDLSPEDKRENDLSVRADLRILSSYMVEGGKLWIMTEADRSATTILMPEDY